MILLDFNILVHAHREDADRHGEIKLWLETQMQTPPGVAVSELVLSGCLRVITHPKIFKTPTPLERALEFVEDFRMRKEVCVLGPGPDHWRIFTQLCRKADARGNLVPDAYHASAGFGVRLRVDHARSRLRPISRIEVEASLGIAVATFRPKSSRLGNIPYGSRAPCASTPSTDQELSMGEV